MPLLGEHMQIVRLVGLVQSADQTGSVVEVHVLVDQAVDEQQSVVPARNAKNRKH